MINLPNYEPMDEPCVTLRQYNQALQEKTDNVVSCKFASRLLDGNNASLRLINARGNWLDVARFVPSFNEVNYPATMTLSVGWKMLNTGDSTWLSECGWHVVDCDEYPCVTLSNPDELKAALDAIFQLDLVTTAICELMANRPRITI